MPEQNLSTPKSKHSEVSSEESPTFHSSYSAFQSYAPKNISHSGSVLTIQPGFASDPFLLCAEIYWILHLRHCVRALRYASRCGIIYDAKCRISQRAQLLKLCPL